jgi:uncharacterized membrane protein
LPKPIAFRRRRQRESADRPSLEQNARLIEKRHAVQQRLASRATSLGLSDAPASHADTFGATSLRARRRRYVSDADVHDVLGRCRRLEFPSDTADRGWPCAWPSPPAS